jgi:hypothetical protein
MGKLFGLLSFGAWLASLFLVSQATVGIWCVATACWVAILVRLHDAEKQHQQLLDALQASNASNTKEIQTAA